MQRSLDVRLVRRVSQKPITATLGWKAEDHVQCIRARSFIMRVSFTDTIGIGAICEPR